MSRQYISLERGGTYRIIDLLVDAKVFEKCIKKRLVGFLNMNKILSDNQFGFREGLSTSDAMFTLTSQIVNSLKNNKKGIAVFIDLAKAFDTTP